MAKNPPSLNQTESQYLHKWTYIRNVLVPTSTPKWEKHLSFFPEYELNYRATFVLIALLDPAITHTESSVLSSVLKDSLLPPSSKYALQQEVVRRYGYDAGQRDMALLKILLSVILTEVDTSAMLSPIILQSCFKRMEYRIYLLLYIPQPS
jgi:hypothetical protein